MPSPLQLAKTAFLNREADVRSRKFPVGSRITSIQRQKEKLKRADSRIGKKLIRFENAAIVLDDLPEEEGDRLHAIVCGDFVYLDLVTGLIQRRGEPLELILATLSLSLKNLETLERLLTRFPALPIRLVLSHYFQSTSKEIFIALETMLSSKFPDRFRVTVGRSHAKLALIDYGPAAGCFVIEGSANLRSSNNIEQISIFRDRELYEMHAGWIEELHAASLKKSD